MSERLHSKLGASSSDRWTQCPASVALCEQMPKQIETAVAKEGTNAHTYAEKVLTDTPNAHYYVGKKFFDFEVTEEMSEHVQKYVDYVRNLKRELQGELKVEVRFHLKSLHPDFFGTCDAVIVADLLGELHIIDFKYGAGIFVDVQDNSQLMFYALGALMELGIENFNKVVIHIAQPRIESDEGIFRKQSFKPQELVQFGKFLKQRALETENPNAEFKEGDHCRWCAAAPVCPQLHKRAIDTARSDFDDPQLPEVKALTHEQIAKVIQYGKVIQNWIDDVKNYAREEQLAGRKIPELKLVAGRGSRQWNNAIEAEKILSTKFGERAYKKQILSVAQAEEHLGKNAIAGLFFTASGNPTIAHESDRRKALPSAQDDFGVIEQGSSKITIDDF